MNAQSTHKIKYRSTRISSNLVIAGMWLAFFHEVLQSFGHIHMFVAYSGYILLFSALFLELMNGALSLLENKYRTWVIMIFFFGLFVFIHGIVKANSLQFFSRDLWPYSYFACFLVAARADAWRSIDRMIVWQFMVGIAVFLYIAATLDIASFTRQFISQNTSEWRGPRIYWAWGLLYGWQYMFLRFRKDQPLYQKLVTILGVISFVVFGVIMLKRQVIVELGMVCVAKSVYDVVVLKSSIIKNVITYAVVAIVVFSAITHYQKKYNVDYIEDLAERTTEHGSVSDTATKNTRLVDQPRYVYGNASAFEIIFGQGLGSGVMKDQKELVNTLESGFATALMKGGVIYLIVWYVGFILILKDALLLRRRDKLIFGFLSVIFIVSSPMGPFFFDYFSTGYKMFWLGAFTSCLRISDAQLRRPVSREFVPACGNETQLNEC